MPYQRRKVLSWSRDPPPLPRVQIQRHKTRNLGCQLFVGSPSAPLPLPVIRSARFLAPGILSIRGRATLLFAYFTLLYLTTSLPY